MPKQSPYKHSDGSNCWTKNCRRQRQDHTKNGMILTQLSSGMEQTKLSKIMSYALRHHPEKLNLELDSNGWVGIDILAEKISAHTGKLVSVSDLFFVVKQDTKKRYIVKDSKIRAAQGHSINIELGLNPKEPPTLLYHGTANKYVESIFKTGLQSKERQFVHLSSDYSTAIEVGERHGTPVVITVNAEKAHQLGYKFYQAENGVWLVESLKPDLFYLEIND